MMGILCAEMLKYKRTFMAKLVIFIPLFFAVYSLVTSYLVPGSYDWNGILVMSFNWWPVTFLPLGYGLFAGMVANLERKAGNYRVLKGEVLSPRRIWLGKIGGMALIAACSSAVLVLGDLVCGMLQGDVPPLGVMVLAALLCWIATLALIPLQLWLATWAGMLASIALAAAHPAQMQETFRSQLAARLFPRNIQETIQDNIYVLDNFRRFAYNGQGREVFSWGAMHRHFRSRIRC